MSLSIVSLSGLLVMSADPVTFMLIGEFCEKDGPVVRHLFAIDNDGMCQSFPQEMWVPGTAAQLQQFMMRAMSGDHVFPEPPDAPLQCRSCEVLMDRVKWTDDKDMVAYVSTVTLHDVFARGYARTACVAYLSSDEHKVLTISHWLSQECQDITRTLHDATLNTHRGELVMCIAAMRHLIARVNAHTAGQGELPIGLTERHRNGLQGELEALSSRVKRATKKKTTQVVHPPKKGGFPGFPTPSTESHSPVGDSFEADLENLRANGSLTFSFCNTSFADPHSPVKLTDDEAVDIADKLITMKGTKVLRPLEIVCGDDYTDAEHKIGRALFAFSMDTVFLLEHMTQMMQPLARMLEQRIGEGLACHWPAHDAEPNSPLLGRHDGSGADDTDKNRFFLKIGDFIAVDPKLRRDPPTVPPSQHTEFSWLSEGRLFAALREFGVHEIITVMYHALCCRPIVVCGEDEDDVLEAMRIAATFVPGVLQSTKDRFGVGVLPFDSTGKVRVTYEHLETYAVVGCHPSSILFLEDRVTKRYLSSPCVWHIHTGPMMPGKKGNRCRTIKVYGHPYTLSVKPSTTQPQQAAEKLQQDPFDRFMGTVTPSPPLLLEVFELLSQRITRPKEEDALSHYLRLTLKRIFVDYASMAACVLHSLVEDAQAQRRSTVSSHFFNGSQGTSQMTSPQQPLSSRKQTNASFSASTSTLPAGVFPATPNPGHQQVPVIGNASFSSVAPSVVNGVVVANTPHYTPHKVPFVVTECDVRQILTFRHGYSSLHADDVTAATNIFHRMVELTAEHEPYHPIA